MQESAIDVLVLEKVVLQAYPSDGVVVDDLAEEIVGV